MVVRDLLITVVKPIPPNVAHLQCADAGGEAFLCNETNDPSPLGTSALKQLSLIHYPKLT